MGVNRPNAADVAGFIVEFAFLEGPLHSEVRFVLARVGSAPVRLPGVGFQHCTNALCQSLQTLHHKVARFKKRHGQAERRTQFYRFIIPGLGV